MHNTQLSRENNNKNNSEHVYKNTNHIFSHKNKNQNVVRNRNSSDDLRKAKNINETTLDKSGNMSTKQHIIMDSLILLNPPAYQEQETITCIGSPKEHINTRHRPEAQVCTSTLVAAVESTEHHVLVGGGCSGSEQHDLVGGGCSGQKPGSNDYVGGMDPDTDQSVNSSYRKHNIVSGQHNE